MSRRLILPPVTKEYDQQSERLRNREIEESFKVINQKLSELESRIKALEP